MSSQTRSPGPLKSHKQFPASGHQLSYPPSSQGTLIAGLSFREAPAPRVGASSAARSNLPKEVPGRPCEDYRYSSERKLRLGVGALSESHSNPQPPNMSIATRPTFLLTVSKLPGVGRKAAARLDPLARDLTCFSSTKKEQSGRVPKELSGGLSGSSMQTGPKASCKL